MKLLIISFVVFVAIFNHHTCFAQNDSLLSTVPKSTSEYLNTEKNALATINWIENTPLNQEELKHKQQYSLLVSWISGSPNVNVYITEAMISYTNKNKELLVFFMAGYAKYCLTHNYSKDPVQGSLAGIRCAIKTYKKGINIEKDDDMEKLIKLETENKLEEWVKENVKQE
jgi:hypothetical protein